MQTTGGMVAVHIGSQLHAHEPWCSDIREHGFYESPPLYTQMCCPKALFWNLAKFSRVLCTQSFWTRLAGKYGNKFFWQEQGEQAAIVNAVCTAASSAPLFVLLRLASLISAKWPVGLVRQLCP